MKWMFVWVHFAPRSVVVSLISFSRIGVVLDVVVSKIPWRGMD